MNRGLAVALLALAFLVVPVAAGPVDAPDAAQLASDEHLLKEAGLPVTGPGLLEFFRKRTPNAAEQEKIALLVRQLGDRSFRTREKAAGELIQRGSVASPALRPALGNPDVEVVRQVRRCLEAIEQRPGRDVPAAAVRLLRARRPAGAAAALLGFLPFAGDEALADDVLEALPELGVRDGTVDPVLLAALTDPAPARRMAAGLVVGRSGTPEQRSAAHRLLSDPDSMVRLRTAQGLAGGGDKTAVPVLLALLSDGPPNVAALADELLGLLAGEQAPAVALGDNPAARGKCRAAWDAWWKANETKIDADRLRANLATGTFSSARQVVRQFLDSFIRGDTGRFQRTTDVPFLLGSERVTNRHDLNTVFFQEISKEVKNRQVTFTVKGVGRLEDYLAAMRPRDKDPVMSLRHPGVSVVYIEAMIKGQQDERSAVFVCTTAGRPRVIGIGNARSPSHKPGR